MIDENSQKYALAYIDLLRAEIMAHQKLLYSSTAANIAATPLLFSLGQSFDLTVFIAPTPIIVMLFMFFPLYFQVAIMRCGRYLKDHIEKFLLSGQLTGYESQLESNRLGRLPEFYFFYLCAGTYVIYFLIAVGLSFTALKRFFPEETAQAIVAAAVLIYIPVYIVWFRCWPIGTSIRKSTSKAD